jgi:hypothetical protein
LGTPAPVLSQLRGEAPALERALLRAVMLIALASCACVVTGCDASQQHDEVAQSTTLGNLTLAVPPGWSVRRLDERCAQFGQAILVANVPKRELRSLHHAMAGLPFGACTTRWDVSGFPSDYVMVDVDAATFPVPVPPSSFPLDLHEFAEAASPCHCVLRFHDVMAGNSAYAIRVWVGNRASRTARRRLSSLIRSIAPRTGN